MLEICHTLERTEASIQMQVDLLPPIWEDEARFRATVDVFLLRTLRVDSRIVSQPEYRGTSLVRNTPLLGPAVGLCLGPHGGPREGGKFLMCEVPL